MKYFSVTLATIATAFVLNLPLTAIGAEVRAIIVVDAAGLEKLKGQAEQADNKKVTADQARWAKEELNRLQVPGNNPKLSVTEPKGNSSSPTIKEILAKTPPVVRYDIPDARPKISKRPASVKVTDAQAQWAKEELNRVQVPGNDPKLSVTEPKGNSSSKTFQEILKENPIRAGFEDQENISKLGKRAAGKAALDRLGKTAVGAIVVLGAAGFATTGKAEARAISGEFQAKRSPAAIIAVSPDHEASLSSDAE